MSKKPSTDDAETPPSGVSIAAHPRARVSIRRTRARVALAAFVLVGLLCLRAGVPAQDAVVRALLAGLAGHLAAWAVGLLVWKQLVMAELAAAHAKRTQRRQALAEAAAARAAEAQARAAAESA
jgi:hypothetical protein